ncbi:MAG: hypothetical protein P8Y64_10910 [Gammaproteobacteria bacterium]
MEFMQTHETGSRLIGAITPLGQIGPKHHGVVIGQNVCDGVLYVAESQHTGYGLATYDAFIKRYSENGPIYIAPNDGIYSNVEVAQRALNEIEQDGTGKYHLISNNCESFANRAIHNNSTSQQVINSIIGFAAGLFLIWAAKSST